MTDGLPCELFEKIRNGDREAKELFVKNNFGLVHMAARKFTGRGTEYEDLFQIGCIGLLKAAEKFDPQSGNKFSTYAVPVIFGEIKRYFRDNGAVKISRSIKEASFKLSYIRSKLQNKLGREPTVSELAAESGLSQEDIILALDCARPILSLSDSPGTGELELIGMIGEDNTSEVCEMLAVREAILSLTEQEREIVKQRYFKSRTQQQTAFDLNISQVQVSRIEKRVKDKLRKLLA